MTVRKNRLAQEIKNSHHRWLNSINVSELATMEESTYLGNHSRPWRRPRACPECGSKNLENVNGEYFCGECDWDGVDIYARICVLGNPWKHGRKHDEFED